VTDGQNQTTDLQVVRCWSYLNATSPWW